MHDYRSCAVSISRRRSFHACCGFRAFRPFRPRCGFRAKNCRNRHEARGIFSFVTVSAIFSTEAVKASERARDNGRICYDDSSNVKRTQRRNEERP